MNRKLFFQTASGISLAMILSGCVIPHKPTRASRWPPAAK